MSKSRPSKVFLFDSDDPEMQEAYRNARDTFRYFWREVAWERRRIIPALDMACVKAPFSDGRKRARSEDKPDVEHMWLGDVDFDGRVVSGKLLNSPNKLKSVRAGDEVRVPLEEISDWMLAIDGEVYGAHTVQLMRSRMGPRERKDHDAAWGLKFGDPEKVRILPWKKKGGRDDDEHPMSVAMAPSLKEQLATDPSMLKDTDDRGWTFLHQEALAGSLGTVTVLLDGGADPNAKTRDGQTPLQLARSLKWDKVIALLEKNGAK